MKKPPVKLNDECRRIFFLYESCARVFFNVTSTLFEENGAILIFASTQFNSPFAVAVHSFHQMQTYDFYSNGNNKIVIIFALLFALRSVRLSACLFVCRRNTRCSVLFFSFSFYDNYTYEVDGKCC